MGGGVLILSLFSLFLQSHKRIFIARARRVRKRDVQKKKKKIPSLVMYRVGCRGERFGFSTIHFPLRIADKILVHHQQAAVRLPSHVQQATRWHPHMMEFWSDILKQPHVASNDVYHCNCPSFLPFASSYTLESGIRSSVASQREYQPREASINPLDPWPLLSGLHFPV